MDTNLSDTYYRGILFVELTPAEKAELIKVQIQRAPVHEHEVGEQVMAHYDAQGQFYMAEITKVNDNGTVDVQYTPPYHDREMVVRPGRIRSIGNSVSKVRVM